MSKSTLDKLFSRFSEKVLGEYESENKLMASDRALLALFNKIKNFKNKEVIDQPSEPYLLKQVGGSGLKADTCLIVACRSGNDEVVRALVKMGVDTAHVNDAGQTALIAAISAKKASSIQALLASVPNAKALVNQKNGLEFCALSHAIKERFYEGFDILMKAGADPNLCLKEGVNPISVVEHGSYWDQKTIYKAVKSLVQANLNLEHVLDGNNIVSVFEGTASLYYHTNHGSVPKPVAVLLMEARALQQESQEWERVKNYALALESFILKSDPNLQMQVSLIKGSSGVFENKILPRLEGVGPKDLEAAKLALSGLGKLGLTSEQSRENLVYEGSGVQEGAQKVRLKGEDAVQVSPLNAMKPR